MRIPLAEHLDGGQQQDSDIEHDTRVLGIPYVVRNTPAHQFGVSSLAAQAIDLRPARDARLHVLPDLVVLDQPRVVHIMGHGMGPRSDKRHLAPDDVEQLRQLIDAEATKPVPYPCHPAVIGLGLPDLRAILGHRHGAELEDRKRHAAMAAPVLAKEYRPARLCLDGQRRKQKNRRQGQQRSRADDDVKHALERHLDLVLRRALRLDRHEASDTADRKVEIRLDAGRRDDTHGPGHDLQGNDQVIQLVLRKPAGSNADLAVRRGAIQQPAMKPAK